MCVLWTSKCLLHHVGAQFAVPHLPPALPRRPFLHCALLPQPLLAVGGASGIIIGLATQQVLGNFVSGLNIFLAR